MNECINVVDACELWWEHLHISVRLGLCWPWHPFLKNSALAIKEAVLAGIISYTTWAADVKWQIIEHGLLIKSHQSSQLNNRSRVEFHKDQFRIKIVTKHTNWLVCCCYVTFCIDNMVRVVTLLIFCIDQQWRL